jgi:hypothetical protein
VLVQIELENNLGSFHTLRLGEQIPFTDTCFHGQLDLFYYRDPGVESRQVVPAVDDYVTLVAHPLARPAKLVIAEKCRECHMRCNKGASRLSRSRPKRFSICSLADSRLFGGNLDICLLRILIAARKQVARHSVAARLWICFHA